MESSVISDRSRFLSDLRVHRGSSGFLIVLGGSSTFTRSRTGKNCGLPSRSVVVVSVLL